MATFPGDVFPISSALGSPYMGEHHGGLEPHRSREGAISAQAGFTVPTAGEYCGGGASSAKAGTPPPLLLKSAACTHTFASQLLVCRRPQTAQTCVCCTENPDIASPSLHATGPALFSNDLPTGPSVQLTKGLQRTTLLIPWGTPGATKRSSTDL